MTGAMRMQPWTRHPAVRAPRRNTHPIRLALALLALALLSATAHAAASTPPNFLPQLTLSLRSYTLSSTTAVFDAFRVQLGSDIAAVSGVDVTRVMLTSLSQLGSNAKLLFTLMPAIGDDTASNAQAAANLFLTRAGNTTDLLYSMIALRYTDAASVAVAPLSSAASLLTEVSFALSIDSNVLNLNLAQFSRTLRTELIAKCSAPSFRVYMMSVTSGAIRAAFIVSPALRDSEDSTRLILDRFRAAMNAGGFVTGSSLSFFVGGSIELRTPEEPMPPAPTPWWTHARLLTFAVGFGVGVFILLAGCAVIIASEVKTKKHKKHPSQRSAYAHLVRSTPRKPAPSLTASERAQMASKRAEEVELQHVSLQIGASRPVVTPLVVPPASAAAGGRRPAPLSTGATPDPHATPHRGVRFQDDPAPPTNSTATPAATPATAAASPSAAKPSPTMPASAAASAMSPVVHDSRNGVEPPAAHSRPSSSPTAGAVAGGAGGGAPRTFRLHFQGSQAKINRQPTLPRQNTTALSLSAATANSSAPAVAAQPQ